MYLDKKTTQHTKEKVKPMRNYEELVRLMNALLEGQEEEEEETQEEDGVDTYETKFFKNGKETHSVPIEVIEDNIKVMQKELDNKKEERHAEFLAFINTL